jgi:hypothetical protein
VLLPPGFWNGVDWRALVKDLSPQMARLREYIFFWQNIYLKKKLFVENEEEKKLKKKFDTQRANKILARDQSPPRELKVSPLSVVPSSKL